MSLISAPPATAKYVAIKIFLTGAYKLSECERASALVNLEGLGDSTPSELMDSMLSLLGGHTSCFCSFTCTCSSCQTIFVPRSQCLTLRTTEHCLKKRIGSAFLATEYCIKKWIRSTFLGDLVYKKSTYRSNQPSQAVNNLLISTGIISVLGKMLEAVHQTANILSRTRETSLRVSIHYRHRWSVPTAAHYLWH